MLKKNQISEILSIFSRKNPTPKTELRFSSEFECLISVILSAQSTDRMVNTVTKKLYNFANTPESMLLIGLNNLRKIIRNLGLFNKKSIYIIKTCNILLDKYGGKVPNTITELLSLPGVGRKTANVILNCIFKKNVIAVDTHVLRVCNRLGFIKEKRVFYAEKKLLSVIPEKFKFYFHNWFVLHGRYICKSKIPNCSKCFINYLCQFKNKIF
ncbi:MAG: endonuclease III [Buchnera aphidicola (Nurudea yanoniella)]